MSPQQIKLLFKTLYWIFRHTQRGSMCENERNILEELLDEIDKPTEEESKE